MTASTLSYSRRPLSEDKLPLHILLSKDNHSKDTTNGGDETVAAMHWPPLFGGWWGKSYGLAPNEHTTARRPTHIVGGGGRQNYADIVAACLQTGAVWEDPAFPAVDSTVFYSRQPPKPFVWKRPPEIIASPLFISDDVSRFDVNQGELGDCWFLAAVANITLHPPVFARVVPADQSFAAGKYCGVFRFQFWQYDNWIEIVVDDRLPTFDNKLVFMHSTDTREFWSALLEKAYAKLCGSYEALKGGSTSEAMEDFSGGLAEIFDLKDSPPANLFTIMRTSLAHGSMMGCSLDADPNVFQMRLENGLIRGHAYSITAITTVPLSDSKSTVQLVRVRNPWGNEVEWTGAWSDKSSQWTRLSEDKRRKLGLVFEADGEFWMDYEEFTRAWDKVEICHIGPEAAADMAIGRTPTLNAGRSKWTTQSFHGNWTIGATAGGCRNYLTQPPCTFAYNPQYKIRLQAAPQRGLSIDGRPAAGAASAATNQCVCIIALMQKYRRKLRSKFSEDDMLTIGFAVYKVDDGDLLSHVLSQQFFRQHTSVARTQSFVNLREVCCRFKLPPGDYVVVPSTFEPHQAGEFLVRVFSETFVDLHECDTHASLRPVAAPIFAVRTPTTPEDEHQTIDKLDEFFAALAGRDGEIDAWELQTLLTYALKKEFKFDTFHLDTCRSMIACVDLSRTGKLDCNEFKELWQMIRLWKYVFKTHDADSSGAISSYELRDALQKSGYSLHSRIVKILVLRYANKDQTITFDQFIGCAVKLKTMLEVFHERDPDKTGTASFNAVDWIELAMYG